MRFLFVGIGVLVLALVAGLSFFSSKSSSEITDLTDEGLVSVVLTEKGFDPNKFRISLGTEVVFTTDRDKAFWPASNIHPSHGIYPAFDPERPIESKESWSFVFDEVGTWGFHDHVRSYYTGTIEVVE